MSSAGTVPGRRRQVWLLALVFLLAPTVQAVAQIPYSAQEIPVVPGTTRDPQEEERLRAGPDSDAQWVRAYRIGASIEQIFRYYLLRLNAQPADSGDTILGARPELGPIKYRVSFHTFEDECVDPLDAPPAECNKMHRAKDKREALDRVRIPNEKEHWIRNAWFTWYRREQDGALTRLRVIIHDIGLSPDWKHYTPLGQVIIEGAPVHPGDSE
jgi:hypothetical protein